MKILQLVPTLAAGGAETFVADLAVAEKAFGHEVDVFLLAGARGTRGAALHAALDAAGIRCIGAEDRNPRDPRNVPLLLQTIRNGGYDVVHAHLFSIELVLASLIPLLTATARRPLLVRTLHSSDIFGTRSRILARMLARTFDWNFACSQKVLDNYTGLFGRSRASVVENGVRVLTGSAADAPRRIRTELGLSDDAFIALVVGAFRGASLRMSAKAQDVAIRAFVSAFGGDASAHLLFAGDGPLRSEAEALVEELGARHNVHFLGSLSNVQPVLRDSDLLFMPSRFEGLPIAGLEAACAGVPVLASSIPELRDVGASHGWVYPSENAPEGFARELKTIRERRVALRRRAEESAEHFRARYGIERCAREYLDQIESLLGDRPRRAMRSGDRRSRDPGEQRVEDDGAIGRGRRYRYLVVCFNGDPATTGFASRVSAVTAEMTKDGSRALVVRFVPVRHGGRSWKTRWPRTERVDLVELPALPISRYAALRGVSVKLCSRALQAIVERVQPEVVQCECHEAAALGAQLRFGGRLYVDIHGAAAEEAKYARLASGRDDMSMVHWLDEVEARMVRVVDKLIVVAPRMIDHLEAKTGAALRDKAEVLPIFADESFFEPLDKERSKRREGLSGKIVFLYSGGMQRYQCIDETITWFKAIVARVPNAHLLLFTPAPAVAEARVREIAPGVQANIGISSVSKADLADRMAAADFGFVLREPEVLNKVASPTKAVEYLARGVRLICTADAGSAADYVTRFRCGLVVPLMPDPAAVERAVTAMHELLKTEVPVQAVHAQLSRSAYASAIARLYGRRASGAASATPGAGKSMTQPLRPTFPNGAVGSARS